MSKPVVVTFCIDMPANSSQRSPWRDWIREFEPLHASEEMPKEAEGVDRISALVVVASGGLPFDSSLVYVLNRVGVQARPVRATRGNVERRSGQRMPTCTAARAA